MIQIFLLLLYTGWLNIEVCNDAGLSWNYSDLLLLKKVLGLWKQILELVMGREVLKNRCAGGAKRQRCFLSTICCSWD